MATVIFLVRHADYKGNGADPSLSEDGEQQSRNLARKIKDRLGTFDGKITVWASSAKRARETAWIIREEMQLAEMQLAELVVEEKLWSDNRHRYDFDWLQEKIDSFSGKALIIVSHLQYVQMFPARLGFPKNMAGYAYAQGVIIRDDSCVDI